MSKWAIGGLSYFVAQAIGVRVSAKLLSPAFPLLITFLVVAVVRRRLWRGY